MSDIEKLKKVFDVFQTEYIILNTCGGDTLKEATEDANYEADWNKINKDLPLDLEDVKDVRVEREGHADDETSYILFDYNGKTYLSDCCYDSYEGISDLDEPVEVHQVEKTIKVWEAV